MIKEGMLISFEEWPSVIVREQYNNVSWICTYYNKITGEITTIALLESTLQAMIQFGIPRYKYQRKSEADLQ